MAFTWTGLQVNLSSSTVQQCIKSIDLSTVKFESIRQEVGNSVLINFSLLSTAYQSTSPVTHKNKPDYHHFEATTKENGHFTKIYCEMAVNQTWRCTEKLLIPPYKYDWSFTWSHTYYFGHLRSRKLMKAMKQAQMTTIRKIQRTKSSCDEESRKQWLVGLSNKDC